jgi:hypothetical protein
VQTNTYRPGRYCISATQLQRVYNPMRGPWTPEKETTYQRFVPSARIYFNRQNDPETYQKMTDAMGQKNFRQIMTDFETYRFGRLLAYLRKRQPDAMIGYSILIYDLTFKDIESAVLGPAEPLLD